MKLTEHMAALDAYAKDCTAYSAELSATLAAFEIRRLALRIRGKALRIATEHIDASLPKVPKLRADHVGSELGLPPAGDDLALPASLARS